MTDDRISYAAAGRAARDAITLANQAHLDPGDRLVLTGILYWTTTYSRTSEHLTLGQIATTAGLWEGPARDCPRKITKRVSARLRALADAGVITYVPGGSSGRGDRSLIAITATGKGDAQHPPSDGQKGDPHDPPSHTRKGDPQHPPYRTKKGDPQHPLSNTERGTLTVPKGGPSGVQKGDPEHPPPEETSEKVSEEGPRARTHTSANGTGNGLRPAPQGRDSALTPGPETALGAALAAIVMNDADWDRAKTITRQVLDRAPQWFPDVAAIEIDHHDPDTLDDALTIIRRIAATNGIPNPA